MKLKYSASIAWTKAANAVPSPCRAASGASVNALQANAILP